MYESITYAELKSLPKEQRFDAWKQLKTLYSTQKELAEKLGVSPAIVSSMITRYAKDESTGSIKVKKLEVIDKPKRTRGRAKKQDKQDTQEQFVVTIETKPESTINNDVESETFSISIKKTISGEDAQCFLNGIGSTLLKKQKYSIEVKISEK